MDVNKNTVNKESERLFKGYMIGHKVFNDIYSIVHSYTDSSPIEDLETKEELEQKRTKAEIIKLIPLFSVFDIQQIEKLDQKIKLKKFKSGKVLFKEGDRAEELYIIKSGRVTLYKEIQMGKKEKIEIANLGKGDLFGETGIILDTERTLSAIVSSDSAELYMIYKENFLHMLSHHAELSFNLAKIQTKRLMARGDILVDYICNYIEVK